MQQDRLQKRSRFILRAMEWDDPKAKYPNVWADGMPRLLLAIERIAGRLRLGDLVATFHPASQRHPERADRFVGLSRVAAVRRAEQDGLAWVELETAFRFDPPLELHPVPRRVFLCCDPGWPEAEVALFRRVYDAAVAAGWQPLPDERDEHDESAAPASTPPADGSPSPHGAEGTDVGASAAQGAPADRTAAPSRASTGRDAPADPAPSDSSRAPADVTTADGAPVGASQAPADPAPPSGDREAAGAAPAKAGAASSADASRSPAAVPAGPRHAPERARGGHAKGAGVDRWFAGVDYSGDMRDPRTGTWLAVLGLAGDRLRVLRLNPTGRSGLEARLRDPDPLLTRAEAIGLDFPFAFPLPFAEAILEGPFPDEGWWALVRRMERLTRPRFLTMVQEFREAHGAPKRLADERAGVGSPLDRSGRDLSPMTFHGIRMIGEDRSRFAVRPFETAQGRLLLEVRPDAVMGRLKKSRRNGGKPGAGMAALGRLPVDVGDHVRVMGERGAVTAVLAARGAALAVLDGEADRTADELAPGEGDRVRREGWIYGVERDD